MKYDLNICCLVFVLLLSPVPCLSADNVTGKPFVTALDLLESKGLAPYRPGCVVGPSAGGMVTAEDLLRMKGLLDRETGKNEKTPDEDIWGLEQDFGC